MKVLRGGSEGKGKGINGCGQFGCRRERALCFLEALLKNCLMRLMTTRRALALTTCQLAVSRTLTHRLVSPERAQEKELGWSI